MKDRKAV